jgi:hypothetical protein
LSPVLLSTARPVPRCRIGSKRAADFIAESGVLGKFWAANDRVQMLEAAQAAKIVWPTIVMIIASGTFLSRCHWRFSSRSVIAISVLGPAAR